MSDTQKSFIRMVWDFYGADSHGTAEHFLRHVREFVMARDVPVIDLQVEVVTPVHTVTFLDLEHGHLDEVVSALKPHRGYEVEP